MTWIADATLRDHPPGPGATRTGRMEPAVSTGQRPHRSSRLVAGASMTGSTGFAVGGPAGPGGARGDDCVLPGSGELAR
ncbi:hypothetical protein CcI6DRAFT_03345 [Frankia sp. CcI6]|nr:hypothetical protein CcI6DRAFT_03345 [Frankia sp. CcI6]KFB04667.1 hypothetical protein ALLO2DRAFT_02597 [Frankia sp. Allo2]OAA22593.1 hypothetical protein AAY23_106233 [Frankia casuarinae]